MDVKIETITPSIAHTYLQKNTKNRPIRKAHVEFLKDEIESGRWQPNGAAIVFGKKALLDGQHRLLAIQAANRAVKSLVVREVPDEYFSTIDINSPRRPADMLSILGDKKSYLLAPAIVWCIRYKEGDLLGARRRVSATRVEQFLSVNQGIRRSLELCSKNRLVSVPVAAACHYIFHKKDATLADLFIDCLINGGGKPTDPFFQFRERMIENAASKAKLHARYQMAMMIQAWNAARGDKKASVPDSLRSTGFMKSAEQPAAV